MITVRELRDDEIDLYVEVRTRVHPAAGFRPHFAGWGYETRRDGTFHAFPSRRDAVRRPSPRVSILIRTIDRPALLREALASCANQTYPALEVVVIEDGPERSRGVVEEFRGRLDIRYRATGDRVGRARAGNVALAEATGEWLNFLDDDDVLFADHVEVLVDTVLRFDQHIKNVENPWGFCEWITKPFRKKVADEEF